MLSASSWGWLEPRNSPVEPLGFSLTPFVILAGFVLLWLFRQWERRREARGEDPLVRLGLIASQLGNVVQSSVDASDRSEAGGLQWTSQQLGSALGTALIGAIVIGGLVNAFLDNVQADRRVDAEVVAAVETALTGEVSFVAADDVAEDLEGSGLDQKTSAALIEGYEDAQLEALRVGLFAAAVIALGALLLTTDLPSGRPRDEASPDDEAAAAD